MIFILCFASPLQPLPFSPCPTTGAVAAEDSLHGSCTWPSSCLACRMFVVALMWCNVKDKIGGGSEGCQPLLSDRSDHIHSATILGRCVVHTLDDYRVGAIAAVCWLVVVGHTSAALTILWCMVECSRMCPHRMQAVASKDAWPGPSRHCMPLRPSCGCHSFVCAGAGADPAAGLLQPLPLLCAHQGK